ncbi:MAG: GldG family protein [Ruminococcus sp.]|nr:GldG family protein [Ruminococcus sp.]
MDNSKEKVSKDSKDLLADVIKEQKSKPSGEKHDEDRENRKKEKKEKTKFNAKKLKHGTMATVLTCVFIAVLVLVNIVTTMLFERYPISIDLTKNKIYSMSKEAESYVEKVDRDVLVTIFCTEEQFTSFSEYNEQAFELLKNYSKLNHHITYRFADIDSNPDVIRDYGESITTMDIMFESKATVDGEEVRRTRKLSPTDLVNFNDELISWLDNSYGMSVENLVNQYGAVAFLYYYGGYIESSNADQAFVSALMTVTDPNPVYAAFLSGREETVDLSYFRTLLTGNGYNVLDIDITTEEIPDSVDLIIVPAPRVDYTEAEVQKLSSFLDNGGELGKHMIYVASEAQQQTPVIDELLEEYGLKVNYNQFIADMDPNYIYVLSDGTIQASVSKWLSDTYSRDVITKDPMLYIMGSSRPVYTLFDENNMQYTEKLVLTSANGATFDSSTLAGVETAQECYAAVGAKARFLDDGSGKTVASNVICFGSEGLLNADSLAASQYQNAEYILSVINTMTGKTSTDGIIIKPKIIVANTLEINDKQKATLKWTFTLIIPVAILLVGGVVWFVRKNK